jgi:hypothetical protein
MTEGGRPAEDQPSRRVVDQRVRDQIIEYLELASSFDAQLEYERSAPDFVDVLAEIINPWQDWVPTDPRSGTLPGVFSLDEAAAVPQGGSTPSPGVWRLQCGCGGRAGLRTIAVHDRR